MFPVEDSDMVPVGSRKKRHHPDGQEFNFSSPKRLFTVAEGERDSSIHSDSGTITCLGSTGNLRDQLVRRNSANAALDWGSSSTSFSASEFSSTTAGVTSVVCFVEGTSRERRESRFNGKSKGNYLTKINISENRRLDADLEVSSGLTLQRTGNLDSPVCSMRCDDEPTGESVFPNVRCRDFRRNKIWVDGISQLRPENDGYRHKTREGHTWYSSADKEIEGSDMQWRARCSIFKPYPSIADDTGSSCIEPSEDLLSEERRLRCADADAFRPNNQSLIQEVETDFQCAGFSDIRGYCAKPSIETKREWEDFVDVRSDDSNKSEFLKKLETAGQTRMLGIGQKCNRGYDSDEYASQLLYNDNDNDDAPNPSYVLSSGRLSQEEVARSGQRPSTIDRDFEEYFASLLL